MTWVKLCGLRTNDDVRAAAEAGADAIGVVLAGGSPRVVDAEVAADLVAASAVPVFLVTVDTAPDDLVRLVRATGAAGAQPHGSGGYEAAEAILKAGGEVLFPIPVTAGADLDIAPDGAIPLFDTAAPGTGQMVDDGLLVGAPDRYVLAGGLTPGNVAGVVAARRPYGVDVSSGIESAPGIKDHALMHEFVEAVK